MSKVLQFMANESGATAIEYGLIAAGDFDCDYRRRQYPWYPAQ